MAKSFRWKAALVIVFAVLLRTALVVAVETGRVQLEVNPDSSDLLSFAHNLATGVGFAHSIDESRPFSEPVEFSAWRPPLYPAFVAIAFQFSYNVSFSADAASNSGRTGALFLNAARGYSFRRVVRFDCRSRICPLSTADLVRGRSRHRELVLVSSHDGLVRVLCASRRPLHDPRILVGDTGWTDVALSSQWFNARARAGAGDLADHQRLETGIAPNHPANVRGGNDGSAVDLSQLPPIS